VEPAVVPEEPSVDRFLARLEQVSAGWGRMQEELTQLRRRVVELEQRLAAVQSAPSPATAGAVAQPRLGATPDGQRRALVTAGLSEDDAAALVQRQGQRSLERLELRDIAQREGWLGTDRYREEIARLDEGAIPLREELGDAAYDRYLYATGEDNRVRVDAIIPGSVAELAGLQPGDLIESYAGQPLFNYSDLRDATAGGERGELVRVQVRRGGRILYINLSRGPLGVHLDTTRAEPLQAP
jgi:membrane-associated protease RseP (regulator of RpoE activity)